MDDMNKTQTQLIAELEKLRKRNTEFEAAETECKKTEEEIRKSKVFLDTIINAIDDLVYVIDEKHQYILINDKCCEVDELTRDEILGKSDYDFLPKEDADRFRKIEEKVFKTGETAYSDDVENYRGKTHIYSTSKSLLKDTLTGEKYIVGISRDISERKKAEESLKERQKELNNIFNLTPDMICVCTPEGKFLKVSPSCEEVLGYTVDEILELGWAKLVHPDDVEPTNKEIESQLDGNSVLNYINRFRCKDGTYRLLEWRATPVIDGIVYAVARDITERKELEKERTKASKLESIGVLAGGIAHDFNNILAVILGNVSLAKISLDNQDEVIKLLTETENASLRATKLTQQLLTFAKGGEPVKEITELWEFIRETTEFSLRGSNVGYHTSISPDLWAAEVDKGQISQGIGNLIINAKQAMPEGGIININAENATVTSEDNLPLKEGDYVKISIEDKGHGIPVEQLTKIFDPYFTTKQKGSGFGLTTTYSIIQRHDGHIAVESELGVGTTFQIYLPASSKKYEWKETVKDDSAVITGKILIMDDEEMVRNFVLRALEHFGNDVEVACDGQEAITLYKKAMDSGNPFDVVIMDLTIPGGMGGKKAIKKLIEIDPEAKAIVSSGYTDDPVVSNFGEYGFKDKISKPYKLEELKKVLNDVMSEIKN